MEFLLIGLVWVLNFAISIWNAYVCGKAWAEAKSAGGYHRFMVWVGATMSACGFTWCYLILEALTAYHFQFIDAYWMGITLKLGYILLVPVILFGSYAITIDSWARAFRQGGVLNYGASVWNTYATYHNTASAIRTFGEAFGDVVDAFGSGGKSRSRSSSSDSKNAGQAIMLLVVVFLVVLSAILGILTTTLIIKKFAASEDMPEDVRRKLARA